MQHILVAARRGLHIKTLWFGLVVVIGTLVALSGPVGMTAGDSYQYLLAADAWRASAPVVGTTHWAMRLPYVVPLSFIPMNEAAVVVLHVGFLCAALVAVWTIGRRVLGDRATVLLGLLIVATPIFIRSAVQPTVDALEATLCITALLATAYAARSALIWPVCLAGLSLGLAFITRQTALSACLVCGLMLLVADRGLSRRLMLLVGLAAVPLIAEVVFYTILTGDPLYRFHVDMRHTTIPSAHLAGGVYNGGQPFLNTDLAARWRLPTPFHIHWTIDPLIRLVLHPSSALIYLLLLPAAVILARQGRAGRVHLAWAFLTMLVVYVVNVFVLSIAPNPRYFEVATFAAATVIATAGAALWGRAPRVVITVFAACVLAGMVLSQVTPSLRAGKMWLEDLAQREVVLNVHEMLYEAGFLRLLAGGQIDHVHKGAPTGAGLYLTTQDEFRTIASHDTCPGNMSRWEVVEHHPAVPLRAGRWLSAVGLMHMMPPAIRLALTRSRESLVLSRSRC